MLKEENFISGVVYVSGSYNSFAEFFRAITEVLSDNFVNCELVCVNDAASTDNIDFIKQIAVEFPKVVISIVHMSYCQGIERAMKAGVDCAIGDFVFEFDMPILDFPIEIIMQTYYHVLEGYDIVSASPSKARHLSSGLFDFIYNKCFSVPTELKSESFRILSRRAINRANSTGKYIVARKIVYACCGLKSDILIYEPLRRTDVYYKGTAKEAKLRKEIVTDSILLFTNLFHKCAVFVTAVVMSTIICLIVYILCMHLNHGNIDGWMIVSLVVSILLFIILSFLIIIINYLHLLAKLIYQQKPYIAESIEKLSSERRGNN